MAESKGNVLIVDDEAPIRHLLEQKLSTDGYHCIAARNADTALNILQAEPVDIVLLDIKMPGKSGMELLPLIKKSYPDVVVIMATVLTNINIAIESIRKGAYDYICKPFNMDTVNYCINRGIEKRRLELNSANISRTWKTKLGSKIINLAINSWELCNRWSMPLKPVTVTPPGIPAVYRKFHWL